LHSQQWRQHNAIRDVTAATLPANNTELPTAGRDKHGISIYQWDCHIFGHANIPFVCNTARNIMFLSRHIMQTRGTLCASILNYFEHFSISNSMLMLTHLFRTKSHGTFSSNNILPASISPYLPVYQDSVQIFYQ
jgi:hypothetical protein